MTPGLQDGVRRPPGGPAVSSCSDAIVLGRAGVPLLNYYTTHASAPWWSEKCCGELQGRGLQSSDKSEETRAEMLKFEQNRAELHCD